MIKPKALEPGCQVAVISLSWGGPATFPHRYQAGVRQLEAEFDLVVKPTKHALRSAEWLQSNPLARAEDLMNAFLDPDIRAVISTIGGDDSIRILPYIDLDMIKANPKVFLGFSDTTISHMACYKAGLVSFYGPTIMAGFGENGGMFPYMAASVRKTLFSTDVIGEIYQSERGWTVEHLDWADPKNQSKKRRLNPRLPWKSLQGTGVHRGHLLGGCIEVLDWLRGTIYWPDDEQWKGAILFLETSEEAPGPEEVIRYLRTYAALGILPILNGIIFGRPGGGIPVREFAKYDQAILQVVREEEGLIELPIITCMDFGHTDPMFLLPYGLIAEIDCTVPRFSILENAVQ